MSSTQTHALSAETLTATYTSLMAVAHDAGREDLSAMGSTAAKLAEFGLNGNFWAQVVEDLRGVYRERFSAKPAVQLPLGSTESVRQVMARHDVSVAEKMADAKKPAGPEIQVPQGTFTVEYPDGTYETLRIETIAKGKFAGSTIASFLSGPDNSIDFTGFAFVNKLDQVHIWKRFANLRGSRKESALRVVLLGDKNDQGDMREAYAMRSGRCGRCHRKLTVPASLHRGLGPECASLLGVA